MRSVGSPSVTVGAGGGTLGVASAVFPDTTRFFTLSGWVGRVWGFDTVDIYISDAIFIGEQATRCVDAIVFEILGINEFVRRRVNRAD